MKTKINIFTVLCVLALLLSNCSPIFNRALLNPTSQNVNPRLPRLELKRVDSQVKSADVKNITANSKMYTLFERELPNICLQEGELKGGIEPIIILNESTPNLTWFYIGAFTVWTIQLLGAPIGSDSYQLEVEFVLTNNNKEIVWRKSYYREAKQTVGFYYGWKTRGDERIIILYREMIQEFKNDLQANIGTLSQKFK